MGTDNPTVSKREELRKTEYSGLFFLNAQPVLLILSKGALVGPARFKFTFKFYNSKSFH